MNPVKGIKLGFSLTDLAAKRGQKIASIPLKDKSSIKILSNKHTFDVYHVKNGRLLGAKGYQGPASEYHNFAAEMMEYIQKLAADGIDVVSEWGKSLMK